MDYYWNALWECIEECDEVDAAEAAFDEWADGVDPWGDEDPMAALPPMPRLDWLEDDMGLRLEVAR
jgi:hypothetical protein